MVRLAYVGKSGQDRFSSFGNYVRKTLANGRTVKKKPVEPTMVPPPIVHRVLQPKKDIVPISRKAPKKKTIIRLFKRKKQPKKKQRKITCTAPTTLKPLVYEDI